MSKTLRRLLELLERLTRSDVEPARRAGRDWLLSLSLRFGDRLRGLRRLRLHWRIGGDLDGLDRLWRRLETLFMSGLGRRRLKPSAWVEALEGALGFACLLRFFGAGARVVLDRWLRLGGLRQLAPRRVVFVRDARRRLLGRLDSRLSRRLDGQLGALQERLGDLLGR